MHPHHPTHLPRLRRSLLDSIGSPWAIGWLLSVVTAFACGAAAGLTLVAQADERTAQAKRRQAAAEHLAARYAEACGPRLSWPLASTPEIIPAEDAQ